MRGKGRKLLFQRPPVSLAAQARLTCPLLAQGSRHSSAFRYHPLPTCRGVAPGLPRKPHPAALEIGENSGGGTAVASEIGFKSGLVAVEMHS